MEIFLLKTEHNPNSITFQQSVQIFNFGETVIEEIFSLENNALRVCGVQCVPSLIAVINQGGKYRLVHEANTPQKLLTFIADAQAAYAAMQAE